MNPCWASRKRIVVNAASTSPVAVLRAASRWRCRAVRTGSRRRTGRDRNAASASGPASATTRRSLRCRRRSAAPTPPGDRPLREDARTRRGSRSPALRRGGGRRRSSRCRTTASASTPRRVQPSRALRPPPARPGAASHRQSTPQRRSRGSSPARSRSLAPDRSDLHRGAIRPGDPAGVGREALLAERLPVLPVGHDDVLAADVAGRERETRGPCRTRPRAATVARVRPCAGGPVESGELPAASAARKRSTAARRRRRAARIARAAAGRRAVAVVPDAPSSAPRDRRSTAAPHPPRPRRPASARRRARRDRRASHARCPRRRRAARAARSRRPRSS